MHQTMNFVGLELVLEYAGPADAMAALNTFQPSLCEHCGQATTQRCSGCKAVAYCSSQCQHKDWIMGHIEECGAIAGKLAWGDVSSVGNAMLLERHSQRLEPIEHGGGGGGGGGHGGGGGGGFGGGGGHGGGGFGGGGGRGWGGGGGRGWSGGWGGRRGWGYGFGHPWMLYYGMWYPWWYWLPASYYASQQPYQNYGVPPYPPQNWGNVPPPTAGQQGYAQVPGQQTSGQAIDQGYVAIPRQYVIPPGEELLGLPFGRSSNASFLEDHVLLIVDLTKALVAGEAPDTEPLKNNVTKWSATFFDKGSFQDKEFRRILNTHIWSVASYIGARVVGDQQGLEKARNALQGSMVEEWATFWDTWTLPPKGMDQRRFHILVAADMKQHVTSIASFVEDIVRGSQKEAVRSVREAVKQARKMGKLLDEAPLK